MQQFTLHIKNKNKLFAKFGLLFNHVMALFLFVIGAVFLTDIWWKWGVLGIGIVSLVYFLFNYKAIKQRFNYIDFLVLLFETLILIIVLKYWAVAIITAVQIFLFIEMRKATRFAFEETLILLKAPFLSKKFAWKDLDNIVLRDNLLTLDFKTNKLIQEEIDTEKSKIDEISFNAYCRKLLIKSRDLNAIEQKILAAEESFKL